MIKGKLNYLKIKWLSVLILLTDIFNPVFAEGAGSQAPDGFWLWTFLGRLHPMIVHFPIGLLYAAFIFEILGWKAGSPKFQSATRIMVYAGAVAAILSVILGLLLSKTEDYGSNLLPIHQWLGIATMALAMVTSYAYFRASGKWQKILLTVTVVGVTVAGHYGAELTHGEDYLTSSFPGGSTEESTAEGIDSPTPFVFANQKGPLSETQIQDLNIQVRTILAHNCYSCHGPVKTKGDLRLDSKSFIFKGGKDGVVVIPGHPDRSELIRRIKLSRKDKEAMPSKGKGLTSNEIAALEFWIKQGAPWPSGPEKSLFRVASLEPRMPPIPPATADIRDTIDRFVNQYFEKKKIKWAAPIDDRLYIRRVYLDVIGLLPPPDSVDAFVRNPRTDKRALLVQSLLDRNDDYAQHWLSFWNDRLRNDYTGAGYIDDGRFDITKWLYVSLQTNKPYNQFVKELISPDSSSRGFISGIKWRGVVNASQRPEMQAAQNVSQVFMGLNLKCASCHNSFVSDWKLDEAYAFASIFSDTILEINRCDKPTGKMAGTRILYTQLGQIDSTATRVKRLKQLAGYMVQPKDGRLYRTLVNRVWAQLMGRGMVEPVDAMDNEPWSQDLLDWMASDFVTNNYDVKKLLFTILTSRTYQLPSIDIKDPGLLTAADFTFKGMIRRRLAAEQFADAVSETVSNMYADSMIVYDLLPRKIKTRIPFPRASLVKNDPFLTALGRPNRETVSTSRVSQANLLQALELTNGVLFNGAIRRGGDSWKSRYPDTKTMVRQVYRSMLGRLPDASEEKTALNELGIKPSDAATQDFLWAMSLHPEFQLIY